METNRLLSRQFEGDSAHLTGRNLFALVADTVEVVKAGAVAINVVVIASASEHHQPKLETRNLSDYFWGNYVSTPM